MCVGSGGHVVLVSYSFCSVSAIPFVVKDNFNFSECYNKYIMYMYSVWCLMSLVDSLPRPSPSY